jgi:hypothetical protein
MEFVNPGTQNNYVRYFSASDKPHADEILQLMKTIGFDVNEQDFSRARLQDKTPPGQLEVWIGQDQGALRKVPGSNGG